MHFKPALRDGSDPLYAPCLNRSRDQIYWKAPKKYRDLGFEPASVRIGQESEDPETIAREARRLTIAMLDHFKAPDHPIGSWNRLIHRYETDEYSPFRKVKANTRISYQVQINKLKDGIGKLQIGQLSYEAISKMEVEMLKRDRSAGYVKRLMTMLRIIAGYGKALRNPDARDGADTLAEMTFAANPRRTSHPTREQIMAIIAEADARKLDAFAAGLLLQWTYMLWAVDVRGHWLPCNEKKRRGHP